MYDDWVTLLYKRNWHNIVNQLQFFQKVKFSGVLVCATQYGSPSPPVTI